MRRPASLRWRLAASHALLVLVGTALLAGLAVRAFASASLAAERSRMTGAVTGVAGAFASALADRADPAAAARQQGLAAGGRVLWLGPRGTVRVDGFGDPGRVGTRLPLPPGLHLAGTPQVVFYAAGSGWTAYAVAPLRIGAQTDGAVLLVRDLTPLRRELDAVRARLWLFDAVLGLIGIVAGAGLARSLARPLEGLTTAVRRMRAGELRQAVVPAGSAEIADLASAFNEMAARVAALDEQRRAFVADAAHELRTPLAALQALAEGSLGGGGPSAEVLEGIARQSARLGRLVESLLALARLDNPEIRLESELLRAQDLLNEARWVIAPLAAERGVDLEFKPAPDDARVRGDPDWLHRALINVLDNAVRYTPSGGRVRVHAERVGDWVRIAVADSGPGVPAEALGRLGARFYRADPARGRATAGSGLGLAITAEVLRRHGGQIAFASAAGQGLTVTLELPAAADPGAAEP